MTPSVDTATWLLCVIQGQPRKEYTDDSMVPCVFGLGHIRDLGRERGWKRQCLAAVTNLTTFLIWPEIYTILGHNTRTS